MKQRQYRSIAAWVLIFCMTFCVSFAGDLSNFSKNQTYTADQFADIPSNAWYTSSVQLAFEYGLINGKSNSSYDPNGSITWAETVKLAAMIHCIYTNGNTDVLDRQSNPWYQLYVEYAYVNDIISTKVLDFNSPINRLEFAAVFANALPESSLDDINSVENNAIPDVPIASNRAKAVYKLYRAGILTGSNASGSFLPNTGIKRSEVATIVTRMILPSLRKSITMTNNKQTNGSTLTAQQISEKCADSIFYIEVYDSKGTVFATGSGFFIDYNGVAVTNHHVINGASSAKIFTTDGKSYDVTGVYDYNTKKDIALLKIDGANYQPLISSDGVLVNGQTIYTIGSPQGYSNTISDGIISDAHRVYDDVKYIQISAPISPGSSGGALINDQGQVVGITTSGVNEAQNLNFAVPIGYVKELSRTSLKALSDVTYTAAKEDSTSYTYVYPQHLTMFKGVDSWVVVEDNSSEQLYFAYKGNAEDNLKVAWSDWDDTETLIYLDISAYQAGVYALEIYFVNKDTNKKRAFPITVEVLDAVTTLENTDIPSFGDMYKLKAKSSSKKVDGSDLYRFYTYSTDTIGDYDEVFDAMYSYEISLLSSGYSYDAAYSDNINEYAYVLKEVGYTTTVVINGENAKNSEIKLTYKVEKTKK